MGGLLATQTGTSVDCLLSVEIENPKSGEKWETQRPARLIALCKEPSGRYALKHRLSLPETARYLEVTFAVLPNGSALCGVHEFVQLYELESSESNSAAASFTLKTHQLPGVNNCAYRSICGFRIGSGWRLAIAFDDNSVRAFAMIEGTLSEVCRLPSLPAGLQPHEILAVRPGVLCVHCEKQNPDNSWTSIFDYVDFAPLGYLQKRTISNYNSPND